MQEIKELNKIPINVKFVKDKDDINASFQKIIKDKNLDVPKNTINKLIKELSKYPKNTIIDFILLDNKNWEDSTNDVYLKVKGIVGSGETDKKYIELGLTK
jgi:hypothetical protein